MCQIAFWRHGDLKVMVDKTRFVELLKAGAQQIVALMKNVT